MAENIQRGYAFELISNLKFIAIFLLNKINLQHVLYFAAFLTLGIGDGITGAYMMDTLGIGVESNPVARYLFIEQGFSGMVMAKVWFTFVMLLATHIIQLRSHERMYWTVNGFLIALTAGGVMAINANLTAISGGMPQAPGEIIFTYLALVLMLTEVGSFVDGRIPDTAHNPVETVAHSCFIFPERGERK